jgi:nucleoside-diphosphate-sugar epimerase
MPIINPEDPILITGASGFIGRRVVRSLLLLGCKRLICLVRPSSNREPIIRFQNEFPDADVSIVEGNLNYPEDCAKAVSGVSVIVHLAASGDKSFSGSVLNCAVPTKNLIEATLAEPALLKRFVNVSSFSVYSNFHLRFDQVLDETCPLEDRPFERFEAYCFGKLKQDQVVEEYSKQYGLPYVIIRPGWVYGPGRNDLSGRIGIDTFGFFMHLGGKNIVPATYVDNCADAIALASISKDIDGQIFNVVDDDLPTSRDVLRRFKAASPGFRSVFIPYPVFYGFSFLWEKYSKWTAGQLPPVFNRRRCITHWRGNRYSNEKLKKLLGWKPRFSSAEGIDQFVRSIEFQH